MWCSIKILNKQKAELDEQLLRILCCIEGLNRKIFKKVFKSCTFYLYTHVERQIKLMELFIRCDEKIHKLHE